MTVLLEITPDWFAHTFPQKLSNLFDFRTDLSSLPLGALRKAQRTLALAQAVSDSEDDNESSEGEISEGEPDVKGKQKDKPEWNTNRRDDLAKRSSKHAYVFALHILGTPC